MRVPHIPLALMVTALLVAALLQPATAATPAGFSDTAVITALLWAKGKEEGKPFEYKLWFSDTYVRAAGGKYRLVGRSRFPEC